MKNANLMRNALFALVAAASLAGCEKTRTVEYYTENTTERAAKLEECKTNPGELDKSPNCVNAKRSQMQSDFSTSNKEDTNFFKNFDLKK